MRYYHVDIVKFNTSPFQNISQKWSTKVHVFGAKFSSNTLIFVDSFLLIFWDGGSIT
jgi:hypothetical protein